MKKVFIKKALPIALSLAMAFNMTAYTKVVKAEENEELFNRRTELSESIMQAL